MYRPAIVLLTGLACAIGAPAFAEQTIDPVGKPDCRVVNPGEPTPHEWVSWSGPCKGGYAHGKGVLEWLANGELKSYYSGDMAKGIEHGQGYYKNRFGIEYSGGFRNGRYDGKGTLLNFDGRYEGQWKEGRRHGTGTMVFTLGGSYRGGWKDDLFHGKGQVVSVGGSKGAVQFVDGRPAGSQAPAQPMRIHRIEPTRTSLRLAGDSSTAALPFAASYAELAPAEKDMVRAVYLLGEHDEPPYPLNGTRKIHESVTKLLVQSDASGPFLIHVKVDSEGNATEVVVPASPSERLTQLIASVMMKEKYKPGLCAGKPCAMDFPFSINVEPRP